MNQFEFCFLDMDGVLTDFVAGMCNAHNVPNPYAEGVIGHFDMYDLLEMDPTAFWAVAEHDFWATLQWTEEGHGIYSVVRSIFPVEQVSILSAPSKNLGSATGKLVWLKDNLPELERRFIFAPNKYYIAGPGKLLIDDNDTNCEMWTKAGGTPFLFPRPWNARHKYVGDGLNMLTEYLHTVKVKIPEQQYVKK